MDIQVSSNLERLLFEVLGRDGAAVAELMARFRADGTVSVEPALLAALRAEFDGGGSTTRPPRPSIRRRTGDSGFLVDPHTAIGVGVAEHCCVGRSASPSPMVCLATAHPAKFPDAVEAAIGVRPALPDHLADLFDRPERIEHAAGRPRGRDRRRSIRRELHRRPPDRPSERRGDVFEGRGPLGQTDAREVRGLRPRRLCRRTGRRRSAVARRSRSRDMPDARRARRPGRGRPGRR